ncbi:MAG: twin-arginine translocation signal domain-containing protein, partial [Bdellovibrionota bacterium]
MKRRDFLKAGAATAATLGVVSKSHSAQQDLGDLLKTRTGYPVLQLFTDDQSAQFRVLNDKGRAVTYGAVSA